MGGACIICRVLVGKSEGKRPLGRLRHRWEDNIRMDHQEVVVGAWTGSIWLRTGTGRAFVNAVMKLRGPYNAENFLTG
jgi:hypothetical protein